MRIDHLNINSHGFERDTHADFVVVARQSTDPDSTSEKEKNVGKHMVTAREAMLPEIFNRDNKILVMSVSNKCRSLVCLRS